MALLKKKTKKYFNLGFKKNSLYINFLQKFLKIIFLFKNLKIFANFMIYVGKKTSFDTKKFLELKILSLVYKNFLMKKKQKKNAHKMVFGRKILYKQKKIEKIKFNILSYFCEMKTKKNKVLLKKNPKKNMKEIEEVKSKKKIVNVYTTGRKKLYIKKRNEKKVTKLFSLLEKNYSKKENRRALGLLPFSKRPEFLEWKGFFCPKGQRLKNFCDFWDQSKWMAKILNQSIGDRKIKILRKNLNEENFLTLSEEIYIFLIFLNSYENDLCIFCLKKKMHFSRFFGDSFFRENLFFKLFDLNEIWTESFREKTKFNKFLRHLSYNTDEITNKIIFSKKKNTPIKSNDLEISENPIFYTCFLSTSKIHLSSDFFIIFQKINPLNFYKKIMLISKTFYRFLIKSSKNINYLEVYEINFNEREIIFWSKSSDSFFEFSKSKRWKTIFFLERKIISDYTLCSHFLNIFFISFWNYCEFRPKTKTKINHFLKLTLLLEGGQSRILKLLNVFISKKKFISFLDFVLKDRFAFLSNFKKKLIESRVFFSLSRKFLIYGQNMLEKELKEKSHHEFLLKIFNLLEQDFIPQHLEEKFKKKVWKNYLLIHRFEKIQKNKEDGKNYFDFSTSLVIGTNEKLFFNLKSDNKLFPHLVFYLASKYRIRNIYIENKKGKDLDNKDLLNFLKTFFDPKTYFKTIYDEIKFTDSDLTKFKENIKIIPLRDTSLIIALSKTSYIKSISANKNEAIVNSILKFMKYGVIVIFLILIGDKILNKKKKEVHKLFSDLRDTRKIVFFCLKIYFSEISDIYKFIVVNTAWFPFLRFCCKLGPRKCFKIIDKLKISGPNNSKNDFKEKSDLFFRKNSKKKNLLILNENKLLTKRYQYLFIENFPIDYLCIAWVSFHSSRNQRRVFDRSYFSGLFREKVNVLVKSNIETQKFPFFEKFLLQFLNKHPIKFIGSDLKNFIIHGSFNKLNELIPTIFFQEKKKIKSGFPKTLDSKGILINFLKKKKYSNVCKKKKHFCFDLFSITMLKSKKKFKKNFVIISEEFDNLRTFKKNFFNFYKEKITKLCEENIKKNLKKKSGSFDLNHFLEKKKLLTNIKKKFKTEVKKLVNHKKKNFFILGLTKFSFILILTKATEDLTLVPFLLKIGITKKSSFSFYKKIGKKIFFSCLNKIVSIIKEKTEKFLFFAEKHKDYIRNPDRLFSSRKKNKKLLKKYFFKFYYSKGNENLFTIIYGLGFFHFRDFFQILQIGFCFRGQIFSSVEDIKRFIFFTLKKM